MVVKRKKTLIDGIDRDILRSIVKSRRPLSGGAIAKNINLSGSALIPRLNNLRNQGIIKPVKISGMRTFTRPFKTKKGIIQKTVRAPRSITWGIDLKKSSRQIKRKTNQVQLKNLAKGRKILAQKRKRNN